MYTYFKTKTDVAQNLINFFQTLTVRGSFHRKDFKRKKYGGYLLKKLTIETLEQGVKYV